MKAKSLLFCGLILSIAAYFSSGFVHYDEHFQTLEFAQAKVTGNYDSLPWEHRAHTRPWLQPALYWVGVSVMKAVGVESPFKQAFAFRLLSAMLSLLAIGLIAKAFAEQEADESLEWKIPIIYSLLWYIPLISVRTSAECLGESLFFMGIALLLLRRKSIPPLLPGILLGLSTVFRPQLGLMVMGALAWMFWISRERRRTVPVLSGIFISVALGILADRWGYGVWTWSAFNYVVKGVILTSQNPLVLKLVEYFHLETMGRPGDNLPWYYYFHEVLVRGIPPVDALILVATLCFFIRSPKSIFTWSFIPYLAIHFLISHKELRYLFPVAFFAPLALWKFGVFSPSRPKWAKILVGVLLVFNFLGWSVAIFRPLRTEIGFFQAVYKERVPHLYYEGENPYVMAGLNSHFYRSPTLILTPAAEVPTRGAKWIAFSGQETPVGFQDIFPRCSRRYYSLPTWLDTETMRPWVKKARVRVLSLYACE